MRLETGAKVVHKTRPEWGVGTVGNEWGCFYTCRQCLDELAFPHPETCPACGRPTDDEDEAPPFYISGKGIFEVNFPAIPALCDPLFPKAKVDVNECRLRRVKQ